MSMQFAFWPLSVILTCSVCVGLVYFYRELKQITLEGQVLRDLIRKIIRRKNSQVSYSFKNPTIKELWSVNAALAQRIKQFENKRSTYDEVLSASAPIAECSDEPHSAADAVIKLIAERTGKDVVAMGVALKNADTDRLELVSSFGAPHSRLNDAILMSLDPIFEEWSGSVGDAGSLYQIPETGTLGDFSVFGVGLSLYVPLRDVVGVCGGIWIGMKQGASTLSPRRKTFIQAVSEYAAASFYAARKAQRNQKKSDSERDFLLGMSHDLRAPGNSAIYALRSILSGDSGALSPEQHIKLSVVEKALEEQLEMLGDVLDYAKHQKGFLSAKSTTVNVARLVEKCVEHFQFVAEGEGLILEILGGPEVSVDCDIRHFQRIISNYLSNAVKYTDHGRVEIFWSIKNGLVEIIVADSGIGVPEEDASCLFQEFRRCENGASRQGVGLGLALTKVLAELNSGSVFYQPNPNGGSRFGLRLAEVSAENLGKVSSSRLESILVIDDDAAVCRTNIRYLRDSATKLVPAADVQEAKELLESFTPDLVVSDLYLGKETAEELLAHIKQKFGNLPVVLLSGSSDAEKLKNLRDKHALTVLEKPVSRQVLQEAVACAAA